MNMDFGSHPCACGLAVRPRRPFGMTKSTAEAPCSGTGLHAPGACGLSADTAPTTLRRCDLCLIQGAHAVRVSKGGQHTGCSFPSFETPRFAWLLRMRRFAATKTRERALIKPWIFEFFGAPRELHER